MEAFDYIDFVISIKPPDTGVIFPHIEARTNSIEPAHGILECQYDTLKTLNEALESITGEVRQLYIASCQDADTQGKGLRLRLSIDLPEFATIPWELLCDENGEFL